jgi:hypothetical protein
MSWVDINSEPRKIRRPSLVHILDKDPDGKVHYAKMLSRVLNFNVQLPSDTVLPSLDEVMTQLGRAQFRYKLLLKVDESLKVRSLRTFYQTPQEIWDLKENCAKMVALLEKMAEALIYEQEKQNEAQNRGVEKQTDIGKDSSAVGTEAAPVGLS